MRRVTCETVVDFDFVLRRNIPTCHLLYVNDFICWFRGDAAVVFPPVSLDVAEEEKSVCLGELPLLTA